MRHASHHSGNSLRIAFIFFCCSILLIAGGLLLKIFLVYRESTFDGAHQYIVEIDESHSKGMIVIFNPSLKSVVMLSVEGRVDNTFGKYLGVPVDAVMSMAIPESPTKLTTDMIFHEKSEKGITIIDKVRLLLFVNSLKTSAFEEKKVTLPVDVGVTEKLLPSLFLDNTAYFDNESIAIVNATGEAGLASKVAHMLTTIGMNVVSVTSSNDETYPTTLQAVTTNTYTVHRLQKLFNVNADKSNIVGISDITLTIGKKSLAELE